MTKLEWNKKDLRLFEYGLDRGVVYPSFGAGVAWSGLVSVKENPTGSDSQPYYLDGIKYMHLLSSEDFSGSIEALTIPEIVRQHEGVVNIGGGLFVSQQKRMPFGFSYRTKIGSELTEEVGYKIHLVYNVLLTSSETKHETKSDDNDLQIKEWGFETTPENCVGVKPSSHFVVDTSLSSQNIISSLEDILYGTDVLEPHLPTPSELIYLFF